MKHSWVKNLAQRWAQYTVNMAPSIFLSYCYLMNLFFYATSWLQFSLPLLLQVPLPTPPLLPLHSLPPLHLCLEKRSSPVSVNKAEHVRFSKD